MSNSYTKLPTEDPTSTVSEDSISLHPTSSSAVAPTLSLPAATNFTSLVYRNKELKGTYVIDNTIQVPSFVFASEDLADSASIADQLPQAPKSKPNAKFGTIDGEIDLVSHLKGKGVVEVEVEDPLVTLKLTVTAKGTSTFISLPRSFRGLIQGGSTSGDVIFSPTLLPRTTTYAVDQANPKQGRYFIGELEGSGVEGAGGDLLIVTSEWKEKKDISIQEYGERDMVEQEKEKLMTEAFNTKLGFFVIGIFLILGSLAFWAVLDHFHQ